MSKMLAYNVALYSNINIEISKLKDRMMNVNKCHLDKTVRGLD